MDQATALLEIALATSVPLWIDRLKAMPYDRVLERALVCGQFIAEHGDNVQFKSKKRGESAEAFNRVAEGLAALSFAPGGVKFLSLHFDTTHPEETERKTE